MNNELSVFNFCNNPVRVVLINDEPWFVAKDVCDVLELADVSMTCSRLREKDKGTSSICTPSGNQQMTIVSEFGLYELVLGSRKQEAKQFKYWICDEVLPSIRKTGSYSVKQETKPLSLTEITTSTKDMVSCISYFEASGDLQLAQLLKSTLGNLILKEQQNLLKPVEITQYEGVIDVANRLGYKVPSNYESALGRYVKDRCGHLLLGHNNRYSTSSHKQVPANMYPHGNKEVETTVIDYCTFHSFYHRNISLIG